MGIPAAMDLTVDEDAYNSSTDSVDEDAELELSCALHDLALRVKNFEANMQGRFKQGLGDEEEEEITEDFDHLEEEPSGNHYGRQLMDSDSASPKRRNNRRRRSNEFKAKPQCDEDEDEYYPLDSDEDDRPEAKGRLSASETDEKEDWDSQEEKEELCELKHNIAKLLASMQEEAKALDDNQADCKTAD
ncbi:hypothetical protein V7S43_016268 [Phytophthora oleae]|uniref:Uncharacterized protein n=1 Tax=Phytophthora oleae TaxID=2107226 RepID=A0ABD3EWH7_9STRA